MPITLVVSQPMNVVAHSGSVVLTVPKGPPTIEMIKQWEQAYQTLIDTHGRISGLVLIRPKSSSRVTAETREYIAEMAARINPKCLGQATVIDAQSIFGTIVRTFFTGLMLVMAKHGMPMKVFATVPDALDWLASLPGQVPTFAQHRSDIETYLKSA